MNTKEITPEQISDIAANLFVAGTIKDENDFIKGVEYGLKYGLSQPAAIDPETQEQIDHVLSWDLSDNIQMAHMQQLIASLTAQLKQQGEEEKRERAFQIENGLTTKEEMPLASAIIDLQELFKYIGTSNKLDREYMVQQVHNAKRSIQEYLESTHPTGEQQRWTSVLREIDEELMFMEDYTHGEDGKRITKMRYLIQETLPTAPSSQETDKRESDRQNRGDVTWG